MRIRTRRNPRLDWNLVLLAGAGWYLFLGPGKGTLENLLGSIGGTPAPTAPPSGGGGGLPTVADYPLTLLDLAGNPVTWDGDDIRSARTGLGYIPGRDVFRDQSGVTWQYGADGLTLTAIDGNEPGARRAISDFLA